MVETNKNLAKSNVVCKLSQIDCINELPDKIQELAKRSQIKWSSSIICSNGISKEIALVRNWDRSWARYLEIDDKSEVHVGR